MIKKSTLSQIFTLITRADNKSRNWMHDKVFDPRYKNKVVVPILFAFRRKIEWVVLHTDTTELYIVVSSLLNERNCFCEGRDRRIPHLKLL